MNRVAAAVRAIRDPVGLVVQTGRGGDLAELTGMSSAPTPKAKPAPSASLDDAFQDFRSEVSRQSGSHEAGETVELSALDGGIL